MTTPTDTFDIDQYIEPDPNRKTSHVWYRIRKGKGTALRTRLCLLGVDLQEHIIYPISIPYGVFLKKAIMREINERTTKCE